MLKVLPKLWTMDLDFKSLLQEQPCFQMQSRRSLNTWYVLIILNYDTMHMSYTF